MVIVVVGWTLRLRRVCAVELIIWYVFDCAYFAPKIVITVDSKIDDSLTIVDEVLANDIATIRS